MPAPRRSASAPTRSCSARPPRSKVPRRRSGRACGKASSPPSTEINAKGGVHGRKLKLISRDDGYDPDRSVGQTKRLIEEDKVFALIGAVGTPTAIATIPISSARNVPFIGPFTGAEFLRAPELQQRRQHSRELRRRGRGLDQAPHRGSALHRHRASSIRTIPSAATVWPASSARWKSAAWSWPPKAPSSATPERSARRCARSSAPSPKRWSWSAPTGPAPSSSSSRTSSDFNPTFVNISFVGANALARELGPEGNGVIVSQVVPFPWDTSLKVVADYQAAQKALDPTLTPDFVSLEGYLSGRLVAAALETDRTEPDARGVAAGHQRRRTLRHRRKYHHLRGQDPR